MAEATPAAAAATTPEVDYTLANPDTLTKYKTAAEISQKLIVHLGWCVEGAKIVELCQKGDALLDEEIAKVFKGKKITKGIAHPCTVSPSSYVTPYTPLLSEAEEAAVTLHKDELVKIQLGAQIDGFGAIVCDNIVVGHAPGTKITGRTADLLLATHYANELMLRLMLPPGILSGDTNEKPPTQAKISQLLERVAKTFDCNVVESTTTWQFERNEIEAPKKIIVAPPSGNAAAGTVTARGEGVPALLEAWGVEVGLSLGSGKVKTLPLRPTLHRRTTTTYLLKRPSSRATLSEVQKRFGTFPFSLRQMEDEKAAKVGVVECVRGGVIRQYEPAGEADGSPVSRLFTTIGETPLLYPVLR
ncbi:Curved DNA-binding protein (42 kDa protein) [Ascosphaera atra]|nr:Curved DNA-binding protein (42 kDa protein) [Ascosphaera atra]